jgi:serine/threonine protein kinase
MHGVGVGHLDVKPSNVILRDGTTPVLVDFGLSGRNIRPGCGTLDYCAPEVLGAASAHPPTPAAADMYAFGCTAFEVLTGELIFDAADEESLMRHHLSHDGWPDRVRQLAQVEGQADLAVLLAACLRPDPEDRPSASHVRSELASVADALGRATWPLQLTEAANAVTELTA